MGEVDKLLTEIIKMEKVIKKAVATAKKSPMDKKATDTVRKMMMDIKKLESEFPKAVAADKKYMEGVLGQIAI